VNYDNRQYKNTALMLAYKHKRNTKNNCDAAQYLLLLYYYYHLMAIWILSGITQMSWYQKKHSPTHTYCVHQSSLISFLYLLWSMASFLFNLCAWQSFRTISI